MSADPDEEHAARGLALPRPEDSDLRRFLTHLVAAVQGAAPEAGAEALALLETDRGLPTEAVLVSLVNDLDSLAGPTVLALDDYHLIDEPDVHEAVTFLLDHLPPQVTIAITTRADPPLPLARLRPAASSWSSAPPTCGSPQDEAAAFLNDVMGLRLEPAHVAALEAPHRGMGRRAAAGRALRSRAHGGHRSTSATSSRRSPEATASSWTTCSRRCCDSQPADVRAFLLDTCVLEPAHRRRLRRAHRTATDGQQMLEVLERANLFVVPLDDQRQWYRYHHLFADALRSRLAAQHAGRARSAAPTAATLVRRAGLVRRRHAARDRQWRRRAGGRSGRARAARAEQAP